MSKSITFEPIGVIHSPYKRRSQAPPQGRLKKEIFKIEIFERFQDGLKDIEGFSHIIILYYLHQSKGFILQVTTPWDTELHGLFTTRSPFRPNPIGFSVVQLNEIKENRLMVSDLDILDNTPVLDIKPYFREFKANKEIKTGWIAK